MKTSILSFVLVLFFGFCGATSIMAQTVYTSKPGGGNWSDPATWTVSGQNSSFSVPTNQVRNNGQDVSNNVIIISSDVTLDTDYTVAGNSGKLIINQGASLVEDQTGRELYFGEQQGADMLRLQLAGLLRVTTARFYKADAELSSTAVLRTDCNLGLSNQSDIVVQAGATLDINGNLLVKQGNPTLTGSGSLVIEGCVMTQAGSANGPINGLFGPNLTVCIRGTNTGCGIDPVEDQGLACNSNALAAITINGCPTPLPVELVSFAARYADQQVTLNWVTASEKNSATFAVERSIDGKTFEALTTVKAAGQSSTRQSYLYTDRMPLAGLGYYRLKQTDFDGTFTYSKVVTVQANGMGEQQLSVYGQPGNLNVEMRTDAICKAIRILDSMGRVLYTQTLPEGSTGAMLHNIQLRQNTTGIYIVQAFTSNGVVSQKVMLASR